MIHEFLHINCRMQLLMESLLQDMMFYNLDWLQHLQCSIVHLQKTKKIIVQLMEP
uniref:Uncharacterized protein n=1 Tax=Arundo donax TaxID=35708 RepID=A0A0A9DWP7_ARUDO